jgi:hypothetical protein
LACEGKSRFSNVKRDKKIFSQRHADLSNGCNKTSPAVGGSFAICLSREWLRRRQRYWLFAANDESGPLHLLAHCFFALVLRGLLCSMTLIPPGLRKVPEGLQRHVGFEHSTPFSSNSLTAVSLGVKTNSQIFISLPSFTIELANKSVMLGNFWIKSPGWWCSGPHIFRILCLFDLLFKQALLFFSKASVRLFLASANKFIMSVFNGFGICFGYSF